MSDPQATTPGPRVAIVGSRRYDSLDAIDAFLWKLKQKHPRAVVVSGAASGVDRHAARVAWGMNLDVQEFPADWERHGRRAGFIRNVAMLDTVEHVVAFWDQFSRGTAHSINVAADTGKLRAVFGIGGVRLSLDFATRRASEIQRVGVMVGQMREKSVPAAFPTPHDDANEFRTKAPPRL